MGVDIVIGVLEDKKHVRHQEHPEAPAIEGHWISPHMNVWGGQIGNFHDLVRRVGLFNLVDCDDYGCWEWGVYPLSEHDLQDIELACARVIQKHPGVKPKCRASTEELDVAFATWFVWWARWASMQNMPAYLQVTY